MRRPDQHPVAAAAPGAAAQLAWLTELALQARPR
jgi:hypothetical protein